MAGQYLEFLVSQERFEEAAALMPRLLKVALLSLPLCSYSLQLCLVLQHYLAAQARGCLPTCNMDIVGCNVCTTPCGATAVLTHTTAYAPLTMADMPPVTSQSFQQQFQLTYYFRYFQLCLALL